MSKCLCRIVAWRRTVANDQYISVRGCVRCEMNTWLIYIIVHVCAVFADSGIAITVNDSWRELYLYIVCS